MTAFTPEAYLFDMDGLLLDTERVYMGVLTSLLVERGWSEAAGRELGLSLVGKSGAAANDIIVDRVGADALETFKPEWMARVKAEIDVGVPVKATVREVLGELSAAGARMAVVTATWGKQARHHLELAGLLGHFETVVGGDEVTANKPDPAPYLEGARRMGVDPTGCAVFEDSDAGTTAGVRAGCRVVQIPDLRPVGVPLPDLGQLVAGTLAEGLGKIRGI